MSFINTIVNSIRILLAAYILKPDPVDAANGTKECMRAIKRLYREIPKATSIGEKQHLLTQLGHVKTFKRQFKSIQKYGSGLNNSTKETAKHRVHWDDSLSAFGNRIRTGVVSNLKHKDCKSFLVDCKAVFKRRISNALKHTQAVKVNTVFCGEFIIIKGQQTINEYKYFTTNNSPIYKDTDLDLWFNEKVIAPILIRLEEFQERDSGWALRSIINLGVNINKYTPMLGSSYIELPPQIKKKEACVNVKNEDGETCFAWAVTSALYPPAKRGISSLTSSYPHYSQVLNLKGIQFPMTLKQIPRFESQNNISINVYILQKTKNTFATLPTYITKKKRDRHVNLLLIQDKYDDNDDHTNGTHRYHYVWIKSLSRLLSSQLSKENGKKYFCERCLHYFRTQEKLNLHLSDCEKLNECAIKMPDVKINTLKFKNYKNKEKSPFIVYADLESVLKPLEDPKKMQQHIPAAIGYYFKCAYDSDLSFYKANRGDNCMEWFAQEMLQLAEDLEPVFLCSYDIHMTPREEVEFKNSIHCHICEMPFTPENKKVRDHNHLIPENNYRGAAHEGCNINYQDSHVIPVVFHNLSGYDAHFIITDIASKLEGRINLLPITKEKYISFTKHVNNSNISFRFIDSFRFMNSSLDKLSSYLKEFPNLTSQFKEFSLKQQSMLTKKGVMPYDYFSSFNRFNEKTLPPIEDFYDTLNNRPCSRKLYNQAKQVWSEFNCQNLGEYVDLYMKTDIMLLADVFEQFRASCLKTYGLDPAHYYTLPGYTWDAMLKYTSQELELLTDQDMYLFVEKGIRGGLSQVCSKRRAHANNKYMPTYNPFKQEMYLMYYDINNQYGWLMSEYLPYRGFMWSSTNIDVTSIADDSPEGYILEVDLKYPIHLHDLHKDIPFCPEHINPITGKPAQSPKELTKLMATLHNKEKYVIHYRALKQALANGLVLSKIHRVLKFQQSPWLKGYIDLNTQLRTAATNEFEKKLYKLMNNAVFGKTMENVRKRVNVRLLTSWTGRYGAESYISKPEFKSCTVFNEHLIAVELQQLQVHLNKPIYVGMSILDISKCSIYDFHYNYMRSAYGNDCTVLYTDTDSLIYELNRDPYELMKRDCREYFDTSDYLTNNCYEIPLVNKKVLGKMKDENAGQILTDYVGLRSKLYSLRTLKTDDETDLLRKKLQDEEYDDNEIEEIIRNFGVTKKAKGVKSAVVKRNIDFKNYIHCLENWKDLTVKQNLIQSEKHKVYSITQEKIALSPHDDKRYLISGTYDTLPFGHYSIKV